MSFYLELQFFYNFYKFLLIRQHSHLFYVKYTSITLSLPPKCLFYLHIHPLIHIFYTLRTIIFPFISKFKHYNLIHFLPVKPIAIYPAPLISTPSLSLVKKKSKKLYQQSHSLGPLGKRMWIQTFFMIMGLADAPFAQTMDPWKTQVNRWYMSPACIAIPPLKKRTQTPPKTIWRESSVFVEGQSKTLVCNYFLFIHRHKFFLLQIPFEPKTQRNYVPNGNPGHSRWNWSSGLW